MLLALRTRHALRSSMTIVTTVCALHRRTVAGPVTPQATVATQLHRALVAHGRIVLLAAFAACIGAVAAAVTVPLAFVAVHRVALVTYVAHSATLAAHERTTAITAKHVLAGLRGTAAAACCCWLPGSCRHSR